MTTTQTGTQRGDSQGDDARGSSRGTADASRDPAVLRRPFALGLGAALLCALPALGINRWERSLDEAQRLVPVMVHLRSAATLLPLLSLAVVIGYVARSAWPAVRALPRRRRVAWVAGLAAAQLALLVATAYAHILTQRRWLFDAPLPFASAPSPDGRRTAYATQSCFLECRVEVHVREGASLAMRRAVDYRRSRGERAHLVWVDGRPEMRGLTAAPTAGALLRGWR